MAMNRSEKKKKHKNLPLIGSLPLGAGGHLGRVREESTSTTIKRNGHLGQKMSIVRK